MKLEASDQKLPMNLGTLLQYIYIYIIYLYICIISEHLMTILLPVPEVLPGGDGLREGGAALEQSKDIRIN